MPLNVRRLFTSFFIALIVAAGILTAQTPQANQTSSAPQPVVEKQPTSAEVMRERISKAKAFIAVRKLQRRDI